MTPDGRVRLRAIKAAEYLGVSRSTLAKWRANGIGPPFHHCGPRLVYYFKDEIDVWLVACDGQTRLSTKSAA